MPRNVDLLDGAERMAARDVAVAAAEEIARRHGDADVGEAAFAAALVALRAAAEIELALCVGALRRAGSSWADIGALLGVSRQAAQQQFGPAIAVPDASRDLDSQLLLTAVLERLATADVGEPADGAPVNTG